MIMSFILTKSSKDVPLEWIAYSITFYCITMSCPTQVGPENAESSEQLGDFHRPFPLVSLITSKSPANGAILSSERRTVFSGSFS